MLSFKLIPSIALVMGMCSTTLSAQEASFSACDAQKLDGREPARCLYETGRATRDWSSAERGLQDLADGRPQDPWPRLYLGHVYHYVRPESAAGQYQDAIVIARRQDLAPAEIEAGVALARRHSRDGRLDLADEVLAAALERAESHGDRTLMAKVRIREASQHEYRGQHLDAAYSLLRQVEDDVFPSGPAALRKEWLNTMMRVSNVLGRHDDVREVLERSLTSAEASGDRAWIASTRYGLAVHHVNVEHPTPATRERARELYRAAVDAARGVHAEVEGWARLELGKLVGGDEGHEHLETCLEIALQRRDPRLTAFCEAALAANSLATDPDGARRRIDRAMASVSESSDPWLMVYGWEERLAVYWGTLSPAEALERSQGIVDSLEAVREAQGSGAGRAGLLAARAGPYYWLSGRLLESPEGAAPDVEKAFRLIEGMRARVLLESLEATRAARQPVAEDATPELAEALRELDGVLDRKVEIQRRWLAPDLSLAKRDALSSELEQAEIDEGSLRQRIARLHPRSAALQDRDFATLDELRRELGEDEALLSFQLSFDQDFYGRFAGGSWLVVSTRAGSRPYRLADRAELEPRVDALLGLEDPGTATAALAALYDELLGAALRDLPDSVRRLVIVPDEGLHRLPFALLRPAEDAEPLVTRYRLSIAPSANLWLRWRRRPPPASDADRSPVLALADPDLTTGAPAGEPSATRALDGASTLPPLPFAREEGRAILRVLGAGQLLAGEDASEHFLKNADLHGFQILHFAAHALINSEVPDRSAVFLTPGSGQEDGWLQPREIAELGLDGRLVVLASCDTAAGQVLRGEGVMSLARAFFFAGSPAVVASLWPLPDRDSARLFERFYRHLGRGKSLDTALAEAQRAMIRRGAPARSWAGVMILGDGAVVPFPGGFSRPAPAWILIAAALMLLAAPFLIRWRRQLRNTSGD